MTSESPILRAARLLEPTHPALAAELHGLLSPTQAREGMLYAHPSKPGVTGLVTRLWKRLDTQEEYAEILWSGRTLGDYPARRVPELSRIGHLSPQEAQAWERRVLGVET